MPRCPTAASIESQGFGLSWSCSFQLCCGPDAARDSHDLAGPQSHPLSVSRRDDERYPRTFHAAARQKSSQVQSGVEETLSPLLERPHRPLVEKLLRPTMKGTEALA